MINRIYKINNKKLYVYCDVKDYCRKIENWMNIYGIAKTKKYDSYIKIEKNKIIFNIDGVERSIIGKINHTDLYPLFYNAIANIVSDNNNILIHSAVLCYNNIGVLIVGDFNSGKTTLCLEALKNGIEVLSTDQSHLCYKDNKIILKKGSNYMKINAKRETIIKYNKEIEIKCIMNLLGICDKGKERFDLVCDTNYRIKSLFKYLTWHSDIPLFTSGIMLNIDRINIYNWLLRLNIPLYNVRGDAKLVIKKIKEEYI